MELLVAGLMGAGLVFVGALTLAAVRDRAHHARGLLISAQAHASELKRGDAVRVDVAGLYGVATLDRGHLRVRFPTVTTPAPLELALSSPDAQRALLRAGAAFHRARLDDGALVIELITHPEVTQVAHALDCAFALARAVDALGAHRHVPSSAHAGSGAPVGVISPD